MTPEERRAYVRGALTACREFYVSTDQVAAMCRDLGITEAEVRELHNDETERVRRLRTAPFVPGILGTANDEWGTKPGKPEPIDLGSGGLRIIRERDK
jgi:hypothetical protein